MKIHIYILAIIVILSVNSCGLLKKYQYDVVDTVYTKEIVTYRDTTIYFEVRDSVVREVLVYPDTVSVLKTDMAQSTAKVSGGRLYHELRNIAGLVPINANLHNTVTTQVRNRTLTRTIEVPAQLNKWQKLRLHLGDALIAIIAAGLVYVIIRIVIRIMRR